MPNVILESQIEDAYSKGKAVFEGHMALPDAIRHLVANKSMNESSAKDYVRNLLQMMKGMEYQRTLNSYATEYFLSSILRDYGPEHLRLALNSVQKHLEYYEGIGRSRQIAIRELVRDYWAKISAQSSLEDHLNDFSGQVGRSLVDGSKKRNVRLSSANKIPEVITVQVNVYLITHDLQPASANDMAWAA